MLKRNTVGKFLLPIRVYRLLFFTLILQFALAFPGYSISWAGENMAVPRTEHPAPGIITGLIGKAKIFPINNSKATQSLRLKTPVNFGDQIVTQKGSRVEMLVGYRVLVRMHKNSVLTMTLNDAKQEIVLNLKKGIFRISASESASIGKGLAISFNTPHGRALMPSGVAVIVVRPEGLRVADVKKVSRDPKIARGGSKFLMQEGTMKIVPKAIGTSPLMIKAFKGVTLLPDRVGEIFSHALRDDAQVPLPAAGHHMETPIPGKDHLLDLQMGLAEATALDFLETGKSRGEKKGKDSRSTIYIPQFSPIGTY